MKKKDPARFGKYLLLERLSIGGMAEVFCAKTAGLDRLLALKRVLPYLAEEAEFIQMFADEARVSSLLKHPNIVSVFDFGQHEGSSYLATEYVAGKDLSSILKRCAKHHERMPLDLAVHVAVCVSAGLGYAHRRKNRDGSGLQIIHRDVSPPNIICGWDGAVKLIDFGIAKSAGRIQEDTRVGIRKGKLGYMSPEQAQAGPIDQRVDVFALGAVLYEMVTGKPVFEGANELELLKKASASKIVPPSRHNPRLPRGLEAVILRALAREPDDRFPSAGALNEALIRGLPQAAGEEAGSRLAGFVQKIFAAEYARDQHRLERLSQVGVPDDLTFADPDEELVAVSDSDLIAVDDSPGSLFHESEALTDRTEVYTQLPPRGRPSAPPSDAKTAPRVVRRTGANAAVGQPAPRQAQPSAGAPGRTRRTSTDDGPTVRVPMLSIKRPAAATTDESGLPDFDIDEG